MVTSSRTLERWGAFLMTSSRTLERWGALLIGWNRLGRSTHQDTAITEPVLIICRLPSSGQRWDRHWSYSHFMTGQKPVTGVEAIVSLLTFKNHQPTQVSESFLFQSTWLATNLLSMKEHARLIGSAPTGFTLNRQVMYSWEKDRYKLISRNHKSPKQTLYNPPK